MRNASAKTIVYAANNRNGLLVLSQLREFGVVVEYLILHTPDKGAYQQEISDLAGTDPDKVIIWRPGRSAEMLEKLADKTAEVLFSCNFGYLIPGTILRAFTLPINLHMSLLPFNKGAFPNVWPILDGSRAGVTLHIMTESFDDGPIIAQREVPVASNDTGKSLYEKLVQASVDLVRDRMPDILVGNIMSMPNHGGTRHTEKEFAALQKLDMDKQYTARELINLMRAMTFPPFRNLYFEVDGRKCFIELSITTDDAAAV